MPVTRRGRRARRWRRRHFSLGDGGGGGRGCGVRHRVPRLAFTEQLFEREPWRHQGYECREATSAQHAYSKRLGTTLAQTRASHSQGTGRGSRAKPAGTLLDNPIALYSRNLRPKRGPRTRDYSTPVSPRGLRH